MKTWRKRIVVMLTVMCLTLSGCSQDTISDTDDHITLRVAAEMEEEGPAKHLTNQINYWITKFEKAHPNVDVVIDDITPTEMYIGEHRTADELSLNQITKERLQTELMAGKGPDILLLSTDQVWIALNMVFPNRNLLLPDINLAMRNGLFYDISAFYDADTALGKEGLLTTVMDAGVIDGKRFVLPLRYNLLTAYVDTKAFEESGLSPDIFDQDIISVFDAITQHDDRDIASAAYIQSSEECELNLIGNLIDYDNQEVLVTTAELADYFRAKQECGITATGGSVPRGATMSDYCEDPSSNWIRSGKGMFIADLDYAIDSAVIANAEGVELGMYPLKSTDGSVTAGITLFGGVTRGSKHPELAYEFLRYFLSEEAQWEQVSSRGNQNWLAGNGWPVRAKGAMSALTERNGIKDSIFAIALDGKDTVTAADIPVFTDEDMPVLDVAIDNARFPTTLEDDFQDIVVYNQYKMTAAEARSMDLDALAESFIQKLEWHLGEG